MHAGRRGREDEGSRRDIQWVQLSHKIYRVIQVCLLRDDTSKEKSHATSHSSPKKNKIVDLSVITVSPLRVESEESREQRASSARGWNSPKEWLVQAMSGARRGQAGNSAWLMDFFLSFATRTLLRIFIPVVSVRNGLGAQYSRWIRSTS